MPNAKQPTTRIVAGVVDVVVIRRVGQAWRVLTLERAPGARSTGAWEIVHGSIEPGEPPVQAALRELREETGLQPERLYSITANPFYLAKSDTLQISVAFAAVVGSTQFTLGPEHSRAKWETFAAAKKRLAWPRTHDLLRQVAWILRDGTAGALEDVLRSR
ncbi:MAG: NUDIX domain-containing protein [Gemmatimonadetes bacterium]|nr:NUDIX domain-containing protein [Gemmatimonadota bacterium]